MRLFLFYLFSGTALLSAIAVITVSKPTRALLSLIVTMSSLSVLYLLLEASFVAMANLIVYAGAVLVLFLFVIMLQGIGAREVPLGKRFKPGYLLSAGLAASAFLILTVSVLGTSRFPKSQHVSEPVARFGEVLFRNYLLPFELTSLLLLLGVFAAVSLAKREDS